MITSGIVLTAHILLLFKKNSSTKIVVGVAIVAVMLPLLLIVAIAVPLFQNQKNKIRDDQNPIKSYSDITMPPSESFLTQTQTELNRIKVSLLEASLGEETVTSVTPAYISFAASDGSFSLNGFLIPKGGNVYADQSTYRPYRAGDAVSGTQWCAQAPDPENAMTYYHVTQDTETVALGAC